MNLKKLTRIILLVAVLLVLSIVPVNAVVFNAAFDSDFYVNCYPDLKAAFGNDANAAYNHYLTYGIKEGRIASPVFDAKTYIRNYPDLQAAFGDDYVAAYNHFLTNGMNEGRLASDSFNVQVYIANYPDLQAAFGNDVAGAYNHYLTNGMAEGRVCTLTGEATAPEDHVHTYDELVRTISSATCKVDGEGIFKCECGEEERRVIPASPDYHDYQLDQAKSTAAGVNIYVCTRCNDVKVSLPEGADHIHNYKVISEKPASCTKEGEIIKQCQNANCDKEIITEVVPKTEHESNTVVGEGFVTAKAVKCVSDGSERVQCKHCQQMFTRVIPAHNYDEGVVSTEATCTTAGVKTFTCKDCGSTKTEEVKALGHDYASTEPLTLVPATCEKTGVAVQACKRCGANETTTLKALGHTDKKLQDADPEVTVWKGYLTVDKKGKYVTEASNGTVAESDFKNYNKTTSTLDPVTTANCEDDLLKVYTCPRCSKQQIEVSATKLGHSVDTSKPVREGIATIDLTGVKNPSTGIFDYTTYDYVEDEDGIVFEKGAVVDCEHEKVKIFTCVNCKELHVEVVEARKEHTGVVTSIPASCTEPGYTTTSCTTCDQVVKVATTEKKVGHSIKVVEATCTEKAYIGCNRCNEKSFTISSPEYVAYKNTLSPDEKAGLDAKATKPALGHNFVGKVTVGTTSNGKTTATVYCDQCKDYITVDYTTAPTVGTPGVITVLDKDGNKTSTTWTIVLDENDATRVVIGEKTTSGTPAPEAHKCTAYTKLILKDGDTSKYIAKCNDAKCDSTVEVPTTDIADAITNSSDLTIGTDKYTVSSGNAGTDTTITITKKS